MSSQNRSTARSERLFDEAKALFPGGVNSPVRAFRSVGGTPRFIVAGEGPYIRDADGNTYIDFVLSWGALALGHAHPAVIEAIERQARLGTSYGAPTELESELAVIITSAMPAIEMLRFVSSGTEAVMSALRLARAATKRNKIIKFSGCYHGHADSLLVQAGSGVATLGLPDSPGVAKGAVTDTLVAEYNDIPAVERLFEANSGEIAAVIVEPVAGNMGFVMPAEGFLSGLRELTTRNGALLIFDEVMTGFRVSWGGAQGIFRIKPDLTCLGKVIGGGLPAAAYGGRREVMSLIAPAGPVYQAGTLSGNPLAMAAGVATLRELSRPETYDRLSQASAKMASALADAGKANGAPVQSRSLGGMWGFFFAGEPVSDFTSAKRADTAAYSRFFHALLEQGVYFAPGQFEAGFVSTSHTDAVLGHAEDAVHAAMRSCSPAVAATSR